MAKTKIKMTTRPLPIEIIDCLSVLDYVNLHDDFVKQKRVEGLSQRTFFVLKRNKTNAKCS